MTAGVLRLLAAAGVLLIGEAARTSRVAAHASPHVLGILFRADGYVLSSNRGLIFGDAQRTEWRLLCTEVFGINTNEQPSVADTPDGRLLVATSRGLRVSSDRGCSWQGVAPFAETAVPALVADPSAAMRSYLAAYTPDAGELGGMYRSDDAGSTWHKLRPAGERDYLRSIRVAPNEPARIYATGQSWDDRGEYTYYLIRSRDAGSTWERTTFELEPHEREVELLAISPTDPDLLALRVATNSPATRPERVLISRNGGESFESPIGVTLLSAGVFSVDGSRAWVAGEDGLFESSDRGRTFARVGTAQSLSYVGERDGRLYVGGYYAGIGAGVNGVGVGMEESDGFRFRSLMELTDVTAPIGCEVDSQAAMGCGAWWVDWERELMLGEFGAADGWVAAGSAGSSGAAVGKRSEGGCRVAGEGSGMGWGVILVIWAGGFGVRRRALRMREEAGRRAF